MPFSNKIVINLELFQLMIIMLSNFVLCHFGYDTAEQIYFLSSEECVQNCAGQALPSNFYVLSYGGMYDGLLKEKSLAQFCEYYSAEMKCLMDCPASDKKRYGLIVLEPFQYVCSHQNYVKIHSQCLRHERERIITNCEGICGRLDKLSEAQVVLQKYQNRRTIQDEMKITESLSRICGITSCHAWCAGNELSDLCTAPDLANFISTFTRLSVNSSRNVLDISGVSHVFPSACIRITLGILGLDLLTTTNSALGIPMADGMVDYSVNTAAVHHAAHHLSTLLSQCLCFLLSPFISFWIL